MVGVMGVMENTFLCCCEVDEDVVVVVNDGLENNNTSVTCY